MMSTSIFRRRFFVRRSDVAVARNEDDSLESSCLLENDAIDDELMDEVLEAVVEKETLDCSCQSTNNGFVSFGRFYSCSRHTRLLHYEDTPDFMKGNPFVQRGYRPAELPISLCLKSLFLWSNETVNIWSHLLGLIYFSFCFFYDNIFTLPRMRATVNDHLVVSLALLCFQACMLLSTCFHLFYCMSERAHRIWLTMDLLGISMSLLGIYLTGIYYSFYCSHMWHNLYLSVFCVLAFATLAAPLHPSYTSRQFSNHRLVLYFCTAAFGIIPALHWVYLNGGFDSPIIQIVLWAIVLIMSLMFFQKFFPNVIIVYTITFVALCFYLLMIPERWMPGRCDFFGWSHQWWHILVLIALVWWRNAGLQILEYRLHNGCANEYFSV